jgi:hypothetical protein
MDNQESKAPMPLGINDFEAVHTYLIDYVDEQLNESGHGTIDPTCVQIRIASADTLAVANCPIRYAFSSWRLQKVRLVFPRMTFNGAGIVTYHAGADA